VIAGRHHPRDFPSQCRPGKGVAIWPGIPSSGSPRVQTQQMPPRPPRHPAKGRSLPPSVAGAWPPTQAVVRVEREITGTQRRLTGTQRRPPIAPECAPSTGAVHPAQPPEVGRRRLLEGRGRGWVGAPLAYPRLRERRRHGSRRPCARQGSPRHRHPHCLRGARHLLHRDPGSHGPRWTPPGPPPTAPLNNAEPMTAITCEARSCGMPVFAGERR
jgi:hypothetical protein